MVVSTVLATLLLAGKGQEPRIRLPNGELAAVAPTAQATGPDPAKTELLKRTFAKVVAPLVIDVFDNPHVFEEVGALPNDVLCLSRLAKANGRRIAYAAGGYVVYREGLGRGGFFQAEAETFDWLDRLQSQNPGQFRGLFTGGVDLMDLDDEGRAMFGPLIAGSAGASKGLVEGTPVSVSIALFPCLRKNGSDVSEQANALAFGPASDRSHSRQLEREAADTSPFKPSADGELDFGTGQILTLLDLCNRAGDKFSFGFQIDSHVRNDPIFVKGRFTKERILDALRLIGTGGPTIALKDSMSKTELRGLIQRVLRAGLEFAASGDETTAYLKSLLDNPNSIDPKVLARFGFSADQVSAATSVSLGSAVSLRGEFGYNVLPDGTRFPRVVSSGLSFGGS